MRFQELHDTDGTAVARGLHPAIAVVSADPQARTAVTSAVRDTAGCIIVEASDLEDELRRAEKEALDRHDAEIATRKSNVAEAKSAVGVADQAAADAASAASKATNDLRRFDELAKDLSAAQEGYEAAVRTEAEAARSLATALAELDRALGQRHTADAPLEQARKARDNSGVPEAVLQQALSLQAALAKAEAEKQDAVRQADEISQTARGATQQTFAALETANKTLADAVAGMSSPPEWGEGVPLPGLVANYRDALAAAAASAATADSQAQGVVAAARSRLEDEQHSLAEVTKAKKPLVEPLEALVAWVNGAHFQPDEAVFADEAFARFGVEGTETLITALSARGNQVIYLTEDVNLLGWAIGLPHEAGSVSKISTPKPGPLVEVGR